MQSMHTHRYPASSFKAFNNGVTKNDDGSGYTMAIELGSPSDIVGAGFTSVFAQLTVRVRVRCGVCAALRDVACRQVVVSENTVVFVLVYMHRSTHLHLDCLGQRFVRRLPVVGSLQARVHDLRILRVPNYSALQRLLLRVHTLYLAGVFASAALLRLRRDRLVLTRTRPARSVAANHKELLFGLGVMLRVRPSPPISACVRAVPDTPWS